MLKEGPTQAISTRFFRPSVELAPYISSYYLIDVAIHPGDTITDWLHPEWGNVRFSDNGHWNIGVDGTFKPLPLQVGTGPTSHTIAFRVDGPTRVWGVGLLPLGCLRLILGVFAMLYVRERRVWVWLAPSRDGVTHATLALSSNRKTLDADKEFEALKGRLLQGNP